MVLGRIAAHGVIRDAQSERVALNISGQTRGDVDETIVGAVVSAQDLQAASVSGLTRSAIVPGAARVNGLGRTVAVAMEFAGSAAVVGITISITWAEVQAEGFFLAVSKNLLAALAIADEQPERLSHAGCGIDAESIVVHAHAE